MVVTKVIPMLTAIKHEVVDIIDLDDDKSPEEIVNEWHEKVRKKLNQHINPKDEANFIQMLEWYLNEIKVATKDIEDLTNLENVILRQIKFIEMSYKRLKTCHATNNSNYLKIMEEVLTYYWDTVMKNITKKKKEVSKSEYRKSKAQICRRFKCLLLSCLLDNQQSVLHVLINSKLEPEEVTYKEIVNHCYSYFLTREKQERSEVNYCRCFIMIERWKTIRKPEEHEMLDKCLYTMFGMESDEEKRQFREIIEKILRPSDSDTRGIIRNYFNYIRTSTICRDMDGFMLVDSGLSSFSHDVLLESDNDWEAALDDSSSSSTFDSLRIELERASREPNNEDGSVKQENDEDDDCMFVSSSMGDANVSKSVNVARSLGDVNVSKAVNNGATVKQEKDEVDDCMFVCSSLGNVNVSKSVLVRELCDDEHIAEISYHVKEENDEKKPRIRTEVQCSRAKTENLINFNNKINNPQPKNISKTVSNNTPNTITSHTNRSVKNTSQILKNNSSQNLENKNESSQFSTLEISRVERAVSPINIITTSQANPMDTSEKSEISSKKTEDYTHTEPIDTSENSGITYGKTDSSHQTLTEKSSQAFINNNKQSESNLESTQENFNDANKSDEVDKTNSENVHPELSSSDINVKKVSESSSLDSESITENVPSKDVVVDKELGQSETSPTKESSNTSTENVLRALVVPENSLDKENNVSIINLQTKVNNCPTRSKREKLISEVEKITDFPDDPLVLVIDKNQGTELVKLLEKELKKKNNLNLKKHRESEYNGIRKNGTDNVYVGVEPVNAFASILTPPSDRNEDNGTDRRLEGPDQDTSNSKEITASHYYSSFALSQEDIDMDNQPAYQYATISQEPNVNFEQVVVSEVVTNQIIDTEVTDCKVIFSEANYIATTTEGYIGTYDIVIPDTLENTETPQSENNKVTDTSTSQLKNTDTRITNIESQDSGISNSPQSEEMTDGLFERLVDRSEDMSPTESILSDLSPLKGFNLSEDKNSGIIIPVRTTHDLAKVTTDTSNIKVAEKEIPKKITFTSNERVTRSNNVSVWADVTDTQDLENILSGPVNPQLKQSTIENPDENFDLFENNENVVNTTATNEKQKEKLQAIMNKSSETANKDHKLLSQNKTTAKERSFDSSEQEKCKKDNENTYKNLSFISDHNSKPSYKDDVISEPNHNNLVQHVEPQESSISSKEWLSTNVQESVEFSQKKLSIKEQSLEGSVRSVVQPSNNSVYVEEPANVLVSPCEINKSPPPMKEPTRPVVLSSDTSRSQGIEVTLLNRNPNGQHMTNLLKGITLKELSVENPARPVVPPSDINGPLGENEGTVLNRKLFVDEPVKPVSPSRENNRDLDVGVRSCSPEIESPAWVPLKKEHVLGFTTQKSIYRAEPVSGSKGLQTKIKKVGFNEKMNQEYIIPARVKGGSHRKKSTKLVSVVIDGEDVKINARSLLAQGVSPDDARLLSGVNGWKFESSEKKKVRLTQKEIDRWLNLTKLVQRKKVIDKQVVHKRDYCLLKNDQEYIEFSKPQVQSKTIPEGKSNQSSEKVADKQCQSVFPMNGYRRSLDLESNDKVKKDPLLFLNEPGMCSLSHFASICEAQSPIEVPKESVPVESSLEQVQSVEIGESQGYISDSSSSNLLHPDTAFEPKSRYISNQDVSLHLQFSDNEVSPTKVAQVVNPLRSPEYPTSHFSEDDLPQNNIFGAQEFNSGMAAPFVSNYESSFIEDNVDTELAGLNLTTNFSENLIPSLTPISSRFSGPLFDSFIPTTSSSSIDLSKSIFDNYMNFSSPMFENSDDESCSPIRVPEVPLSPPIEESGEEQIIEEIANSIGIPNQFAINNDNNSNKIDILTHTNKLNYNSEPDSNTNFLSFNVDNFNSNSLKRPHSNVSCIDSCKSLLENFSEFPLEPNSSKSSTKLPLKKRKMSVSVEDDSKVAEEMLEEKLKEMSKQRIKLLEEEVKNNRVQEEKLKKQELSYPATPMLSIADIELSNKTKPFKTAAERKDYNTGPVVDYVASQSQPNIVTEQYNNHTYNNATINYHMNAPIAHSTSFPNQTIQFSHTIPVFYGISFLTPNQQSILVPQENVYPAHGASAEVGNPVLLRQPQQMTQSEIKQQRISTQHQMPAQMTKLSQGVPKPKRGRGRPRKTKNIQF